VPSTRLDHLVVTAGSLDEGVEHVRRQLGVDMQKGGEHALMGTHNFLLKLGEKLYLEVIAPNPEVPPPGRPRWFELDSARTPRLATWVARCDDVRAVASSSLGKIESMSRGNFEWLMTVPEDGRLHLGGIAPTLLQWRSKDHPAETMKDHGCSLVRLEGSYPEPEKVRDFLDSMGFEGEFPISKGEAGLVAQVRTPGGTRRLR